MCYAVDDLSSLNAVVDHFYQDVIRYCPESKRFLLGLKSDLRLEESIECVHLTRVAQIARVVQAHGYYECSALKGTQIQNVMFLTVTQSLESSEQECCTIL